MDFHEILLRMEACKIDDIEVGHINADELLVETALNTDLSKLQRQQIVETYKEVEKWYA